MLKKRFNQLAQEVIGFTTIISDLAKVIVLSFSRYRFLYYSFTLIVLLMFIHFVYYLFTIRFRLNNPSVTIEKSEHILVVIPARNEAATIRKTLEHLARLDYPYFHAVIVEDHSTDATRQVITDTLSTLCVDHIWMTTPPRPENGWLGKHNALQYGVREGLAVLAEKKIDVKYLVFIDADTRLSPTALTVMLKKVKEENIDLLSVLLHIERTTAYFTKLMAPYVSYLLNGIFSFPPRTGAVGTCIMVKRAVFTAVGGYSRIRSRILDDLELARLVKRSGYKVRLYRQPPTPLYSLPWYTSLRDFMSGLSKHTRGQFQTVDVSLKLFFLNLMALIPLVAFIMGIVIGEVGLLVFSVYAYVLMALQIHFSTRPYHSSSLAYSLLYMFIVVLFLWSLVVLALPMLLRRRDVTWKGRRI